MRIALVSCVKQKLDHPAPARDLYTSLLFRGLRHHAEANSDSWFILSAEHGLLHPDTIVAPYERTLNLMAATDRSMWASRVLEQLGKLAPAPTSILMLAGLRYRERLVPVLLARGISVDIPLAGLRLGQQLQWLKRSNGIV